MSHKLMQVNIITSFLVTHGGVQMRKERINTFPALSVLPPTGFAFECRIISQKYFTYLCLYKRIYISNTDIVI